MTEDYLKGLIEEVLYVWADPIDIDELSKIYVATTTKGENEAGEEEEKTEEKKITITLNDTNLGSTIITNILYNNSLTICLGVSTDAEEFAVQTESANNIVKILMNSF